MCMHACVKKRMKMVVMEMKLKFVGRQNGERKKGRRSQANASERC